MNFTKLLRDLLRCGSGIFIMILLLSGSLIAQTYNFSTISRIPNGCIFTCEVKENVLFYGNGGALDIVDISEPGNPVLLSRVDLGSEIYEIEFIENEEQAYIETNMTLYLVDYSDLGNPQITVIDNNVFNISVDGNTMYVSKVTRTQLPPPNHHILEMLIYDISNPSSVREIYSSDMIESIRLNLESHEDLLFYIENDVINIVNVADRANPTHLGIIERECFDYALRGDYVYVADISHAIIHIIDISDPRNPEEVNSYELTATRVNCLKILGNNLYASTNNGYVVLNIRENGDINIIYENQTIRDCNIISVGQELLLLHKGVTPFQFYGGNKGVEIFDISDPTSPDSVGHYIGGSSLYNFEVRNDRLFAANGFYGFRLYDVSDITAPFEIGNWCSGNMDDSNNVVCIASTDDLVFLGYRYGHITILDIQNLEDIQEISTFNMRARGLLTSMEHKDGLIYANYHHSGIYVFDVSDPENPVEIGSLEDRDFPGDYLTIAGEYLFWVDDDAGFKIVNIEEPEELEIEGEYIDDIGDGHYYEIAVKDNYAFLSGGRFGVQIFDISDLTNPELVNRWNVRSIYNHGASSIAISEEYAYVTLGNVGIFALDISNLPHVEVEPVGFYEIYEIDSRLSIYRDRIILGSYDNGITILSNDLVSVSEQEPSLIASSNLVYNYPNPFNGITTINFENRISSNTILRVFTSNGRLIKESSLGYLPAGKQTYSLNLDGFCSGNYLIQVDHGYAVSSKCVTLGK